MSKFFQPRGILESLKASTIFLFALFQNHRFHKASEYFFVLVLTRQDTLGIE